MSSGWRIAKECVRTPGCQRVIDGDEPNRSRPRRSIAFATPLGLSSCTARICLFGEVTESRFVRLLRWNSERSRAAGPHSQLILTKGESGHASRCLRVVACGSHDDGLFDRRVQRTDLRPASRGGQWSSDRNIDTCFIAGRRRHRGSRDTDGHSWHAYPHACDADPNSIADTVTRSESDAVTDAVAHTIPNAGTLDADANSSRPDAGWLGPGDEAPGRKHRR